MSLMDLVVQEKKFVLPAFHALSIEFCTLLPSGFDLVFRLD